MYARIVEQALGVKWVIVDVKYNIEASAENISLELLCLRVLSVLSA